MLRLFKFLFTGDWHLHKWKRIRECDIKDSDTGLKLGEKYTCQCEECGRIKTFKSIA